MGSIKEYIFSVFSMEAEYVYNNSLNTRSINMVQSNTPYSPPISELENDTKIHEFDRAMANLSLGLPENLIPARLIGQVQVGMTRKVYTTITNDRYHGIQPDFLARKWGIVLEKTKATLKCTTQESIRSSILPLTRHYRTDLMPQRLRRLIVTWYTDTLFTKMKSIEENTCAQLFTDGEFVFIKLMTSKAEAAQVLKILARDICVPNTMIRYRSLEQKGDNTEFAKALKRFNIESSATESYTPRQNRAENVI